jgi:hypothetical protein
MPVHGPPDLILFEIMKKATALERQYVIHLCEAKDPEALRKELCRATRENVRLAGRVPILPASILKGVDTVESILAPLTSEAKEKLRALLMALEEMEPATHIPASMAVRKALELGEFIRFKKKKV